MGHRPSGDLRGALGFTRKKPPHATTIGRALARSSLERSRAGFARWLATLPQATAITVAVDGTTSEQGHDAHGGPIHMLNDFAHGPGPCLAQSPVTDGKPPSRGP